MRLLLLALLALGLCGCAQKKKSGKLYDRWGEPVEYVR